MVHLAPLRQNPGVKLKLAKEFVGFTDADKQFRALARTLNVGPDQDNSLSGTAHKLYQPFEIRKIRQHIMKLFDEAHRSLPPLMIFRMSKGGVGKTTIGSNVAACFAQFGYKTLVIDGDPQGSLSKQLGYDINELQTHVGHLLHRLSKGEPTRIQEAVIPIYGEGMLDLIPADVTLAYAESWLQNAMNSEALFTRLMEKEADFFKQYEVVVIDTAPSTSRLTNTFMVAGKIITAIVMPEAQSILAIDGLQSNIAEINAAYPDRTAPLGLHIIVNRFRQSIASHLEAINKLGAGFGQYMNDTVVKDFVGFLRETDLDDYSKSAPVLEKEPNSIGARDIIDITKSLQRLYNVKLTAPGNGIS